MDDTELNRLLKVKLEHLHEPWKTGSAAINSANSILQGNIVLANKSAYHIEGDIDWGYHWPSNDKTNRMYFLSLLYVGDILDAYHRTKNPDYLDIGKKILESFIKIYREEPSKLAMTSSEDQAFYLRASVLVKAIQTFRDIPNERRFCADLFDLLVRHAQWMYDDKHHVENNHGVMTDFGLIISCIQLDSSRSEIRLWLDKAYARLLRLIQGSFDEDGMNNENSFDYQRYNIKLYSTIIDFSKHYDQGIEFISIADPILEKARKAFQYIIWQNGLIPPVGDTPINSSGVLSINGSIWFRASDVLIIKNDRLYFSLKCGFKIPSHKHVDDGSITLRYDGHDILVDSGSFSYDRADPYRICLESARGHSGIYPDILDGVLASNYCRNYHASSSIDYFDEHNGFYHTKCHYVLKKNGISVTREMFLDTNRLELRIEDSYSSEASDLFRQQFIFHPDSTVEIQGKTLRGSNGPVRFSVEGVDGEVRTYKGEREPMTRGWYSPNYSKIFPTSGLDFCNRSNNGKFITMINFKSDI